MKLSKFWISIISVVAGLAVIVTALGFIPLKNAPDLASDNMTSIVIYTDGVSPLHLSKNDGFTSARFEKVVKAYNDTRKFSVLRGILTGKAGGMTLTPDNEEESDNYRYNEAAIKALAGDSFTHMLLFRYDSVQKLTVKGEEFSFNSAKILVTDTEGDIGEFTIALFDTNQFFVAPSGGDERYSIRYIKAKGKCSVLFNALTELTETK